MVALLGAKGGLLWAGNDLSSPAQIAGLVLWLDAATLTTLADGDPVASWTDRSGLGNHATQPTGGFQPLYKTGIFGSRPAVLFDAVDDYLICNGPAAAFSGSDVPMTAFIVLKHVGTASTQTWLCWGKAASGTPFYDIRNNGNGGNPLKRDDAAVLVSAVSGNLTLTVGKLISVVFAPTTVSLWSNGAATTVADSAMDVGVLTTDVGVIGARPNGAARADFMNGYIAEVVVYTTQLGATDRRRVEQYLAAKNGLVWAG